MYFYFYCTKCWIASNLEGLKSIFFQRHNFCAFLAHYAVWLLKNHLRLVVDYFFTSFKHRFLFIIHYFKNYMQLDFFLLDVDIPFDFRSLISNGCLG